MKAQIDEFLANSIYTDVDAEVVTQNKDGSFNIENKNAKENREKLKSRGWLYTLLHILVSFLVLCSGGDLPSPNTEKTKTEAGKKYRKATKKFEAK